MCNTYSLGRQGPDALRAFLRAARDETGTKSELPGIHPKTLAPVVLDAGHGPRARDRGQGCEEGRVGYHHPASHRMAAKSSR